MTRFLGQVVVYFGVAALMSWSVSSFSIPVQAPRPTTTKLYYVHPSSPTSQTPPMSAQKILHTQGSIPGTKKGGGSATEQTGRRVRPSTHLSDSILASCDTLPCFSTSHGLLSPETVMRMDKMTQGQDRSETLLTFFDTYSREGPMSCLPMLSDPHVLPHLTEAMRDLC